MTKTELKELIRIYKFVEGEEYDAIEFVVELLEMEKQKLQKEEPYATNTIKNIEHAIGEVINLRYVIDEIKEEE